MKITVIEGSNYFRGLLLLISKDRKLTEPEIILMKRIGKALGFEKDFCNDAIHEILENKFVLNDRRGTKDRVGRILRWGGKHENLKLQSDDQ